MSRFLTRLAINSAALLIASAGGCVALIFLVIAFYLLLAGVMAPWLAALATAGIALLFCIVVLLIARLMARAVAPAPVEARGAGPTAELGALLGRHAREFVETNSWAALAGLLVVGVLLGISPRLRSLVWKLL